ncbi:iron-containing alcohol dehydrogenase [Vagococcus xieshaowenii]|uniref:Iron-containing alcohol dehydrogenase n=1 Tax=Vagococcus xieshaowenii TaxID=2562451 RepID=A0AAJ5EFE0_9ENTE|nr:iron-containing alcohol dehydrogenase [Vagococcus xieshaowenii]QCA29531.1 iron-containing alcohol dehydrogenase [Vagococcus xieshaowenii]TFZ42647.1 iron-containing alcohol dehydrogenase [Vagococcus xieshaowenii]
MENFQFYAPTKVLFGREQVNQLPECLSTFGQNVLLVYGGGSIKKNGLYDKIQALLGADFNLFELAGVEPNPRIETVRKGVALCQEHEIDVILAVGGGSTIDCSKGIAAGTFYDGDPWDFTSNSSLVTKALPIVSILTLAATGSEMNGGSVLSDMSKNEKLSFHSPLTIPKVSILDPENTFSVPAYQTMAGSSDIMSHLIENYFSKAKGAQVQDRIAEGLMRTVKQYTPIALEEPTNYEARANLMWASSLALNGLTGRGKSGAWTCHAIEHELSAYYDITHGIGLAIVTPRWMEYVLNEDTVDKFAMFAVNVMGLAVIDDKYALAKAGIYELKNMFKAWGVPMTLPEVGIGEEKLALMAEKAIEHSALSTSSYVPLTADDVLQILTKCLK